MNEAVRFDDEYINRFFLDPDGQAEGPDFLKTMGIMIKKQTGFFKKPERSDDIPFRGLPILFPGVEITIN